jgi:hypothetical protein
LRLVDLGSAIYLKNKFRDDSTHHSGHQIHPHQQVLEAGIVADHYGKALVILGWYASVKDVSV